MSIDGKMPGHFPRLNSTLSHLTIGLRMPKTLIALVITIVMCSPVFAQGKKPEKLPQVYCGNPEISKSPWLRFSTIEYSVKQGKHQTKYFARYFSDECGLFQRYNDREPVVTTFLLIDSSVLAFKGLQDGESWFDSFESGNLFLYTTLFGLTRIAPSGAIANNDIKGHSSDPKRTLRLSTPGDCHFELAAPWTITGTAKSASHSTEFSFTFTGNNPNPKMFPKQPKFTYQYNGKWSNIPPQAKISNSFDLTGFQFAYLGGPLSIKGAIEGKSFKTLQELRNAVAVELNKPEAK